MTDIKGHEEQQVFTGKRAERQRLQFKPVYVGIPSVISRAVHSQRIDSISLASSVSGSFSVFPLVVKAPSISYHSPLHPTPKSLFYRSGFSEGAPNPYAIIYIYDWDSPVPRQRSFAAWFSRECNWGISNVGLGDLILYDCNWTIGVVMFISLCVCKYLKFGRLGSMTW